jgi:hypothetical protein
MVFSETPEGEHEVQFIGLLCPHHAQLADGHGGLAANANVKKGFFDIDKMMARPDDA